MIKFDIGSKLDFMKKKMNVISTLKMWIKFHGQETKDSNLKLKLKSQAFKLLHSVGLLAFKMIFSRTYRNESTLIIYLSFFLSHETDSLTLQEASRRPI